MTRGPARNLQLIDLTMLTFLVGMLVASAWMEPQQAPEAVAIVDDIPLNVETPTVSASTPLPRKQAPVPTSLESTLPDFSAMSNVSEKKRAFFDYMLPMIRESNDRIREIRSELLAIDRSLQLGGTVTAEQINGLHALARRYRVTPGGDLHQLVDHLLVKVDVVPASLVLAQAANESGWGTSRFARQANNMFGVWCFTEGCGLTPLAREAGLTHEVASYESVQDSVDAYIHTINTNGAYIRLREIRAETRGTPDQFCGVSLAEGLLKYSARGEDYVREIQHMIRTNNLQKFNSDLPLQA